MAIVEQVVREVEGLEALDGPPVRWRRPPGARRGRGR